MIKSEEERMKAAVFYGPGNIRVEEINKPELLAGEVLIQVKAAGVCGSDLHFYKGEMPVKVSRAVLGHESSGEVVAVGKEVQRVKIGDRVGIEPLIGCEKCVFCQVGDYHLCSELKHIGIAFTGGFAEYTKAPQDKVFKLPAHVSYEEAALLDCYAVSIHAIHRLKVKVNDTVAVIGAGTTGLTTVQAAKIAGANKVIVIGRRDDGLQIAKKAGADVVLNASKQDIAHEILNITDNLGVDIAFDCVGSSAPTLNQAIQIVRRGGKVGIIGAHTNDYPFDCWNVLAREIDIIPAFSYSKWNNKPEFEIALELLAAGKFNALPLITHKFSLEKINDAFLAFIDKGKTNALKILIIP